MNNIPKILKTIFLIVFILQMLSLIFLLAVPNLTKAADADADIRFRPQVTVGDFEKGDEIRVDENTIGFYIQDIYKYAIGIVGILAAVVLMIGGVIWITAGGNQTRIGEAKAWIGASLTGLIIALTSYMILFTVNPDLVNFKPIIMPEVENQDGCCSAPDGNEKKCVSLGEKTCKNSGFEWMPGGDCINNKCEINPCYKKSDQTDCGDGKVCWKDECKNCLTSGAECLYLRIESGEASPCCKGLCDKDKKTLPGYGECTDN
jgi:hypothetical protein